MAFRKVVREHGWLLLTMECWTNQKELWRIAATCISMNHGMFCAVLFQMSFTLHFGSEQLPCMLLRYFLSNIQDEVAVVYPLIVFLHLRARGKPRRSVYKDCYRRSVCTSLRWLTNLSAPFLVICRSTVACGSFRMCVCESNTQRIQCVCVCLFVF